MLKKPFYRDETEKSEIIWREKHSVHQITKCLGRTVCIPINKHSASNDSLRDLAFGDAAPTPVRSLP